jgi:hypothetical protein
VCRRYGISRALSAYRRRYPAERLARGPHNRGDRAVEWGRPVGATSTAGWASVSPTARRAG